MTYGARTPHREALEKAWTAAGQVEHEDASGNYQSRDFYLCTAIMWGLIALAEKGGTGGLPRPVVARRTDDV